MERKRIGKEIRVWMEGETRSLWKRVVWQGGAGRRRCFRRYSVYYSVDLLY
jgi:hypothetical protein